MRCFPPPPRYGFQEDEFEMTCFKKLNRLVAWILGAAVAVYIITGLAMTGRFGFDSLMSVQTADRLHSSDSLLYLLIITLVVHVGSCIYPRIAACCKTK